MKSAMEIAAEVAAADGVDVEQVLAVGVSVLAGLDTTQRRALASVLRTPDHMRAAAMASVGRTIVQARKDLSRHTEISTRWDRRRRREEGGL
jgi:hypothetical protein